MLRKLSLVAFAAASLGVAALAPTTASAFGGHGGGHGGGFHGGGFHGGGHGGHFGGHRFFVGGRGFYGYGYNGYGYNYGYDGCYVRSLVGTPWGPRWRLINRCY